MKKGMKTLALVLSLIMVLGLFAGCEADTKPTETTPPATQPAPEAVKMDVFWNVNYTSHYINSTRTEYGGEGSGVYSVSVGKNGGQQNNRVKADQMDKLNGMQFFGVERDAEGVVTKVLSVAEMGGSTYSGRVTKVEGNKITIGTAEQGVETIEVGKEVKVYSAWSTTARYVGVEMTALPGDNVTVILDNLGDITAIWVTARTGYSKTVKDCPCAACVAAREADASATTTFKLWTTPDALPTAAGHYFLEGDVTVRGQSSIAKDAKVVLDLNGFTVTGGTNARNWSMHNTGCTLDILDTSEAKTGKMLAWPSEVATTQGIIIWVRYGTLTLWGGTYDSGTGYCTSNGHSICMEPNTTLNIKDGVKIIGGTAKTTITDAGAMSGGYGGAIYATTGCVINMEGGEIVGGKALSGMSDKSDGRGQGGAIFLNNTAVLNMTGGKITKGTADNGGDCIAAKPTATINNNGGTIEDIYVIPAA